MIKVMFSVHRDADTPRAKFQHAVIASAEQLKQLPQLRRYVHRFVSVPLDGNAEAYLELWLDDDRNVEGLISQAPIQQLCAPGAPFWLKPLR